MAAYGHTAHPPGGPGRGRSLPCWLAAPTGPAASAAAVIRDCSEDGVLDGNTPSREIEKALEQLPSDLDEYTDCRSVIRGAQLAVAKGKGKDRPRHPQPCRSHEAAERRRAAVDRQGSFT